MSESIHPDIRLAVLIDADNVSAHHIKPMMEEIARYGNPTIKRIYGDWTRPNLSGWKSCLLDYALSPVQQFSYTTGKNATDSALIIDAMDLLYSDRVDGFCLVSSDSDFTRLAMRLREAGMIVYGLGELKTPSAFIAACDRFIFLEILLDDDDEDDAPPAPKASSKSSEKKSVSSRSTKKNDDKDKAAKDNNGDKDKDKDKEKDKSKGATQAKAITKIDTKLKRLFTQSIHDVEDEDGWAYLGEVGNLLLKKQPSFDARNYGFRSLSALIRSIDLYEIEFREGSKSGDKLVYIRVKEEPRKKTERTF